MKLSRSVARYRGKPPREDEANLVERLKRIAQKKRRRGYRLAYRELRREGLTVNHIIDACGVGSACIGSGGGRGCRCRRA